MRIKRIKKEVRKVIVFNFIMRGMTYFVPLIKIFKIIKFGTSHNENWSPNNNPLLYPLGFEFFVMFLNNRSILCNTVLL